MSETPPTRYSARVHDASVGPRRYFYDEGVGMSTDQVLALLNAIPTLEAKADRYDWLINKQVVDALIAFRLLAKEIADSDAILPSSWYECYDEAEAIYDAAKATTSAAQ